MKRFSPVLFALPVALALSPAAAMGQGSFNFSLSTPDGVIITGVFSYTSSPVSGAELLNGFTGTCAGSGCFSDPDGEINPSPPPVSRPGTNAPTILKPDTIYYPLSHFYPGSPPIYGNGEDDLFYSNLDPLTGTEFDQHGILLYAVAPVYDYIEIQGTTDSNGGPNGAASQDLVKVIFANGKTLSSETDYFRIEDTPGGGITLQQVPDKADLPESSSMSMLVLCSLGLAGAFFFKSRRGRQSLA